MLNILMNPVEEFLKAKQQKNLWHSLVVLLLECIIFTLGFAIWLYGISMTSSNIDWVSYAVIVLSVFVAFLVFNLFVGYLYRLIFRILTDKGSFFEAITVLAYSGLISSIGFLVYAFATLITAFLKGNAILGILTVVLLFAGFIVLFVFSYKAIAVMFRGFKELFETDSATVLAAYALFWLPILLAMLYIIFIVGVISMFGPRFWALGVMP
ncbi:MAG: Yip1 family protein [Candidatus Diapherotrites archaeon]